ncbi:MAG: ThuA domain-containing protein [Saprospiraceae bacterium]
MRISIITTCFLFLFASTGYTQQFKALLFTKTAGWHHESINEGVTAIRKMGENHHFSVQWTDHAERWFTDEMLAPFDVIIFLNTTGNVLNEKEQAAMERFIQAGKGFVGIHAASDTEYEWEWYTKLVGRMFHIHPEIQTAKIKTENANFPGMESMGKTRWFTDEWYEFGEEKIAGLNYILSIDEKTYSPSADWGRVKGDGMGDFHPLAWYHEYDGGRSFYTALGHLPSKFSDPVFLEHLYGGIMWSALGKGL